MSDTITFNFDFSSSYSYIAEARVCEIEDKTGKEVLYRPILLGAVFQHLGHTVPLTNVAKMDYFTHDLKRCAGSLGIEFNMPAVFPFNAIEAMRIFYAINDEERCLAREFCQRVFHAAFSDAQDLSQPENVAAALTKLGFDREEIVSADTFGQAKAALKSATQEAITQNVFGAPTFIYQGELFWGADRIDALIGAVTNQS